MARLSAYFVALLVAACSYQVLVDAGPLPIPIVQENTPTLWATVLLEARRTESTTSVQATITGSADIANSTAGGANPTIVCNVARSQTATDLTTTAKAIEEITAGAGE